MSKVRIGQLLAFSACVAAVFFLPYLVPPSSGISLSTMAGYSNRAAQLVLLGGGLLFALWTRGWGLRLAAANTATAKPWRWMVPGAAVAVVTLTALYLWHWAAAVGPYDEAIYFLDRFSNQAAGDRVYRDFTFDYGPLLYYPSWWIAALLRLPVGHAYYVFWLAQWVAGTVLLWRVIAELRARSLDRVFTFTALMLCWYTSITDQGAQYTPLRFIVTSACALWVCRLWQKRSAEDTAAAAVPALLAALACYTVLLLYSPEQSIGFALATVLYFALAVRRRAVLLPLLGFAVVSLVVFAVAAHLGLLQSLFTFAGGAYNLPVLPSWQTLFLIPMLLAAACAVIDAFRTGEAARPEIYLIALALVAVPAAFGRADAGHIFINTMPALLVLTLALLQRRAIAPLVVAGWAFYIAGAYSGHTRHMVNVLMHSWPRVEKMPDAAQLPPAGVGLRAPIRYYPYLDGQFGPKVKTGRYYGYDLVFPGLAELKIAELAAHPRDLLVVPVDYAQVCAGATPEAERHGLHEGLMTFYTPHLKGVPNVKQPLCDYIHTHYMASPFRVPREEYRVMQPKAYPLTSPVQMLPKGVAPAAAGRNETPALTATRLP